MKHYRAFNKKYHNESTALDWSERNYLGVCVCVCVWGGGGGGGRGRAVGRKLPLRVPTLALSFDCGKTDWFGPRKSLQIIPETNSYPVPGRVVFRDDAFHIAIFIF